LLRAFYYLKTNDTPQTQVGCIYHTQDLTTK